ncbi:hypothetical protein ABNQ39_34545 [Azospirillum sp. A26]|uniref:hypothetical protein n=1 Tax=Azospirillum sp. A26 TaxID=3160607 RepID=UPI00366F15D7
MTMSIDHIGRSPAPLSSAGGTRRAADAAPSTTASSVSAGAGTPTGDSVSVGKLAKALKGPAADAFQYLDPKARGMLEGLVTSGKMSADEVVDGLNHLAKTAGFDRFMTQSPATAGEAQAGQKMADLSRQVGERGQAGDRALAAMSALDLAHGKGQVSDADYAVQVRQAGKAFEASQAKYADSGNALEEMGQSMGFVISSRRDRYADQQGADQLPTNDTQSKEFKAYDKLTSMGFDASVYQSAFTRYAAGAEPAASAKATSQAAPNSAPQATSQPDAPPTPPTAAATAEPRPAADRSNAAAALSMLQSALTARSASQQASPFNGSASAGTGSATGAAESMLQALKTGTNTAAASQKADPRDPQDG